MESSNPANIAARRVELKFVIDASQSLAIRQWARDHMLADQNVAIDANDTYQITSLYLDTPHFDIYHRTQGPTRSKHRLRRYGCENSVWLETKRKSNDVVKKRRTVVTDGQIAGLLDFDVLRGLDPALSQVERAADACQSSSVEWFQRRVHQLQLRPATYVSYDRFARVANDHGQAIRLTIDTAVCGALATDWDVPARLPMPTTLTDMEVLELKFEDTLPSLFKGLMLEFAFTLNKFSKYRSSVDAHRDASLGLVA